MKIERRDTNSGTQHELDTPYWDRTSLNRPNFTGTGDRTASKNHKGWQLVCLRYTPKTQEFIYCYMEPTEDIAQRVQAMMDLIQLSGVEYG